MKVKNKMGIQVKLNMGQVKNFVFIIKRLAEVEIIICGIVFRFYDI